MTAIVQFVACLPTMRAAGERFPQFSYFGCLVAVSAAVAVGETLSSVALVVWLQSVLRSYVILDHKRRLIYLCLLHRRHQRKSRKCSKYWVHPLLTQRDKAGAFHSLWTIKGWWKNILITLECRYQHLNNYCNASITVCSDRIQKWERAFHLQKCWPLPSGEFSTLLCVV
jgi:hypothetical protein